MMINTIRNINSSTLIRSRKSIGKHVFNLSCISIISLSSHQALAEDTNSLSLTGNLSLATEYISRGLSQTDDKPALQGGMEANYSGLYGGIWGSNVEFNDGDEASIEIDYYGGYRDHINDNLSFDIGGIYYSYPGANDNLDYDFVGIPLKVAYDFDAFKLGAGVQYFPDYFASSGTAFHTSLNADIHLPKDFYTSFAAGHQTINDEQKFGRPDYTEWSAKLGYKYQKLDLSLAYYDTDLSKSECSDGCDARFVLRASTNFDIIK